MEDLSDLERNDLEISESRVRLAIHVIGALAFCVLAAVMLALFVAPYLGLTRDPPKPGGLPWLIVGVLISAFCIAFFGAIAVQVGRRLFGGSGPVVFLTETSFEDRRISPQRIPWTAIRSVSDPMGKDGGRSFYLDVDPSFAVTLPLRWDFLSRCARACNRLLGYRGLWIITMSLESPFNGTLFDVARERLRVAAGDRGTPSS
ncbi:MAG: hypothetical protein E7774_12455 [Bradyrhizobium sp.]|nr:MAG: hypothetical protein E7774_12455 [Bradyrhizobium sp.]